MLNKDLTYLNHILDCINDIEDFCKNYTEVEFIKSKITFNACIRMLEVIGEATKKISNETKNKFPEIEWKKIAGLRDVLIHNYEGVDLKSLWGIIQINIPELKQKINQIIIQYNKN